MEFEELNKCILKKLHIDSKNIKIMAYKKNLKHFYYNDKEYIIITSDDAIKCNDELSTKTIIEELSRDSINLLFVFDSMYEALKYKESPKNLLKIYLDAKIIILPDEEKTDLYSDSKGENYLYYKNNNTSNDCVESKIYNISLYDLIQLYNRTGYSLFEYNVRIGLNQKDRIRLKEGFILYFYYELRNELGNDFNDELKNMMKSLSKSLIDIDDNLQNFENNPSNFWLLHNGISIYVSQYVIEGNKITLSNDDSYVINGAQTLTTIFEIVRSISKIFDKNDIDSKKIDNVLRKMFIKTNIIKITNNNDAVSAITKGLNSQLQITSQGLLTRDKIGIKVNNLFLDNNINLLLSKDGDTGSMSFTPRELMQLYSIYSNMPGRGKNYPSPQTSNDLKKFYDEFSKDKKKLKYFYKCVKFYNKASNWWNKKPRTLLNDKEDNQKFHDYYSYGYHYFLWFCKIIYEKSMYENLDFNYLFVKLFDLLETVKIQDKKFDFSFNTFRKDEFIDAIIEEINNSYSINNVINLNSFDEKEILNKIGIQGCGLSTLKPREFYFDVSKYQYYSTEETEDSELKKELIDDFLDEIKTLKFYDIDKDNNLILINSITLGDNDLNKISEYIDSYIENYDHINNLEIDICRFEGSKVIINYDCRKELINNVSKVSFNLSK